MKEVPPTMKKLSILLALLLALTTLGALAELATKAYEVTLGDFLGDTDLMAFRNEGFGMQGIVDASGNVLVPNEYYDLSLKNPWGYIVAAKLDQLNGKGVIDATGKVLTPFEYAEFEVLSKDWVIAITLEESTKENYDYQALFGGYGSGYYLIVDRTFFNMKTGQAVGKVARTTSTRSTSSTASSSSRICRAGRPSMTRTSSPWAPPGRPTTPTTSSRTANSGRSAAPATASWC